MPTFRVPLTPQMVNTAGYHDYARNPTPPTHSKVNENSNGAIVRGTKKRPTSAKPRVTFNQRQSDPSPQRARKRKPTQPEETYDYEGLTNQMRKITFGRGRRWKRSSDARVEEEKSKDKSQKAAEEHSQKDNISRSTADIDAHCTRRHRPSLYSKYRYPQAFHTLPKRDSERFRRAIPECLRVSASYYSLPVRQNCKYLPMASVTHLRGHCVQSGCLPHPETPGQVTPRRGKRRRPTSAPVSRFSPCSTFNKTTPGSSGSRSSLPRSSRPPTKPCILPGDLKGEPDDLFEVEDDGRRAAYHHMYNREDSVEVPVVDHGDGDGDDVDDYQKGDTDLVNDFEAEEDSAIEKHPPSVPIQMGSGESQPESLPSTPPPRVRTRKAGRESSPESVRADTDAEDDKRKKVVREMLASNERQRRRRGSAKSVSSESLVDAATLERNMGKQERTEAAAPDDDGEGSIEYEPDYDRESILSRSAF